MESIKNGGIVISMVMVKQKMMSGLLFGVLMLLPSSFALASAGGWSWGIGYHNPPNATIGLNFMHLWSNWAVELGVGYINSTENDGSSKTDSNSKDLNLALAGDINLKYLFGSGTFRPYLQGGTFAGMAAQAGKSSGASASLNNGFAGVGFFIMNSSFDFYISYVTAGNGSLQLGFIF